MDEKEREGGYVRVKYYHIRSFVVPFKSNETHKAIDGTCAIAFVYV